MPTLCTVTGTIVDRDGDPIPSVVTYWTPRSGTYEGFEGFTFSATTIRVQANLGGAINVDLAPGIYDVAAPVPAIEADARARGVTFSATVPDEASAILSEIVGQVAPITPALAAQAAASAAAALASANAAAVSASNAAASASAATLAALAAGAPIYVSTAAGLAGTADGDIFIVVEEPGGAVYLNDGGSAVLQGYLSSNTEFADITTAEAAAILSTVDLIRVRERAAGDGAAGGGWYRREGSEPSHTGKFQSADNAWWGLDPGQPITPEQFGATGDGTTDDSTAIQNAANYCRTVGAVFTPQATTYFCGTTTLYFGGLVIRGAGMAKNTTWPGPKTIFKSNANPILSATDSSTATASFSVHSWEDFCVKGAGGAVGTIDLWDEEDYAYQIGIWFGRSHNFMQTITGGEVATDGGADADSIRRVLVEDVSGWGVYAYKWWGQSILSGCFFRRCGCFGAFTEDDDKVAGCINVAGVSVDWTIDQVHCFATGNSASSITGASANWDRRGTALRIGADKATTDGLDRLWELGGNQKVTAMFAEVYNKPLVVYGTRSLMIEDFSCSGESIDLLITSAGVSGSNITFGKWRSFGLDEINIQAPGVNLGEWINQQDAGTTRIKFAAPFRWRPSPRIGATSNTTTNIALEPDASASTYVPEAIADLWQASPEETVMTPPSLHSAGTANTGWGTTLGTPVFFPHRVRVGQDEEAYFETTASARLDIEQVLGTSLTSGSPSAGGKLYLELNKTSAGVTTYSDAALSSANASPVVADGSGNLGEIYAPAGIYRVRTTTSADAAIATVDNYRLGFPYTLAFWVNAGASFNTDDFTFGYRNGSGVLQQEWDLGSAAPVGGRVFFKAVTLFPPADGKLRVFFKNVGANDCDVSAVLVNGILQDRGWRRLPAAIPTTAGLVDLANPGVRMRGAAVWDPASIADGDQATTDITVTGAKVGDFVTVAPGVDVVDLIVSASVTADNTVTVVVKNDTGGAVDLASSTWAAEVMTR